MWYLLRRWSSQSSGPGSGAGSPPPVQGCSAPGCVRLPRSGPALWSGFPEKPNTSPISRGGLGSCDPCLPPCGGEPTPLLSHWTGSEPPQTRQVAPGGRGGDGSGQDAGVRTPSRQCTQPARLPTPDTWFWLQTQKGVLRCLEKRRGNSRFFSFPGSRSHRQVPRGGELVSSWRSEGTPPPPPSPSVLRSPSLTGQCGNPHPSPLAGG